MFAEPPRMDGVIQLRSPRADDIASVFEYGQDPDMEQTHWLPLPFRCSYAQAQGLVEELCKGWGGREGLAVVIADSMTDRLIGLIMLSRQPEAAGCVEVAYGVAPAYRNQGIATGALRLLAAWAFTQPVLKRLELRIGVAHRASQRVAEKAGFVREGVVRSHVPATSMDYDDILYARQVDTMLP